MIRTYKFRLYPTEEQVKKLEDTIGTCRHLYNDSLGERRVDWDVGFYEQKQLLTLRKQDNKYLKQVHSQVLQDVLLRLDKAYQAFFKKLAKYPKFKRKGKYNSFTYPQYNNGWKIIGDDDNNNKLVLSCIGAIKIKMHREIPVGTLKTCTIVRDVDQWYACITADDDDITTRTVSTSTEYDMSKPLGIDVGLINWLTLSDGNKIQNPLNFEAQAKKIRQLQRNLARKQKGSKNREKARIALAKAWRQVRRCRDDFVHKTSRTIADQGYTLVAFEKLNIANMVKNHHLAQAIMDATWGKLRQYTAYKVEKRGGRVLVVNPGGTSQKCSRCGVEAKEKLDLSVRTFECRSCGLVIDRDLNAAKNIEKLGLEQAHAETEPLLVQRQRISKFQSRKQEAHVLRRG
ncbi:transposase, IS605 OrfB [Candidatus Nitrososphaera gargensis Ga9.2]|uniref:Transposase, IS605 OrfB n=1 Tax=Nitrososphaera gargensis (strain Ga9.2) TaxID=1237085 RepID=K0IG87_NITGG|nr:RNA-guided endonuclease TnpB family protein [Candidatus Nitrososphaera gargensis]AFU57833.1 transposase, IS605 OrfB [Candidatus Nitrososphaera gargensis Ga9.2]